MARFISAGKEIASDAGSNNPSACCWCFSSADRRQHVRLLRRYTRNCLCADIFSSRRPDELTTSPRWRWYYPWWRYYDYFTCQQLSTDEFLASSFASLCHDEWIVQLDDFFSYCHPRHNTRGAIGWIWNYIHFLSSLLGIPASHRGRHGCGPLFAIGANRRRKLDAHIFGKLDDPFNRDVWALVAMTFTNFPSFFCDS